MMYCSHNDESMHENGTGEWISVDDRLPDAGVPVLVYRFPSIEIAVIYNKTHDEKYWWLQNVGVIGLENYKWWMPLPEPPKG